MKKIFSVCFVFLLISTGCSNNEVDDTSIIKDTVDFNQYTKSSLYDGTTYDTIYAVSGVGTDYGFDINNLSEEEILRSLEDDTTYSILIDSIGDGSLNDQINDAIIKAVLENDYSQLIDIYECLNSFSREERSDVLKRLKEVELSIYISISNAIIDECKAIGFENIEDGKYAEMQSIIDRMLQLDFFSNYLLKNPLQEPINYENLDFDSNSSIEGYVTMYDVSNIITYPIDSILEPQESIENLYESENYEFSASKNARLYKIIKDIEDLEDKTDSESEVKILSQIPYISKVVDVIYTGFDIYSILTTDVYHNIYIEREGTYFSTEINGELYYQQHYYYMYMDLIQNDDYYETLYNYYVDMNKYIENGEYEEFYNSEEYIKYDQTVILISKSSAENEVYDKINVVEDGNE